MCTNHHTLFLECMAVIAFACLSKILHSQAITEKNNQNNKFPYEEFLNYTYGDDKYIRRLDNDIKKKISNYLCTIDKRNKDKSCSCNPNCVGNCCIDALWESARTRTLQEYLDMFVKRDKLRKCLPIIPINTTDHVIEHIYMVNSYYNGSKMVECPKQTFTLPVRSTKGDVFISESCAILNKDMMLKPLEIASSCENATNISKRRQVYLKKARKCMFSVVKQVGAIDLPTCRNEINSCSRQNINYDLCKAYLFRIKGYKNPHCFLCEIRIDVKVGSFLIGFRILKKSSLKPFCNFGQTYNKAKNKCEQIRCQKHLELRNSKCVPRVKRRIIIITKKSTFESCLTNYGLNLYLESKKRSFIIEDICSYLKMKNCNSSNITFTFNDRKRKIFIQKIESKLSVEDIKSRYTVLQAALKQNRATIMITSSQNVILSKFHKIKYLNNFPDYKICYKIRMLDIARVNFKSNCNLLYDKRLYSWTNISAWIILDKFKMKKFVFVCEKFYMISNCSSTFLPNSEIMLNKDGSITYLKGTDKEKTYQVEEYVPTKRGVLICIQVSDILIDPWSLSAQEVERFVSLICSSISLPSYILVILTFSMFDQFHTIPGKCTLMLTCSLLFGDSLMLFASIIEGNISINVSLCKAFSISIHFVLILAQSWCFVIALDLTLTFKSTATLLTKRSSKTFHSYVATNIVFSLCTVTISVLMDYFKVVDYDYAKNDVCIPHGSYGHLYFYLIPTLIGFALSLILLIAIMLKISYDVRRNQNVLGSNHTLNIASMALKLTLVLGLSEGIGFIQNPGSKGNEKTFFQIVGILYSFIRSLRGLLIALVYLCRKDVLDTWKEMFVLKIFKRKSIMRNTDTATSAM